MSEKNYIAEDVFMQRIQQVFKERDEEFRKRESAYKEKSESLQRVLNRTTEERKLLEQEKKTLEIQRKEQEQQKVLLEEAKAELQRKQEELEKKEQNLIYENNLQLEQVRNEKLKLGRLTEDYEYKIALMDNGVEVQPEKVDLEKYMLRSEHEKELEQERINHGESMKIKLAEISEMRQELEQLRAERVHLLKQTLGMSQDADVPESGTQAEAGVKERESDFTVVGEIKTAPEERVSKENVPETGTFMEDLTASVLKKYIEKNKEAFYNPEIRHSDAGDLLYLDKDELQIRFLFSVPARFDILAKRKNSMSLRRKLKEMNEQHSDIKFQYIEDENVVRATGYFMPDMKAYQVMERVEEVCNCFRQG